MTSFDVAVVGGGPAGAAVAITLASAGRTVVVFDRAASPGIPNGEVLGPEVAGVLMQLGAWESFLESGSEAANGVWSAWGDSNVIAKDFVLHPLGHAWRVDRSKFDALLSLRASELGVKVVKAQGHVDVQGRDTGWRVVNAQGNPSDSIECRFVIDATGRSASIARSNGARRHSQGRLVALLGLSTAREDRTAVADDVLMIESAPEGWWYSVVLPSGELVAGFLTDADLLEGAGRPVDAWTAALLSAPTTASRAAGFVRGALQVRPAAVGCLDRAGGPGWIAVGDAASTIDPLSGIGVVRALASGIDGARRVIDTLDGDAAAIEAHVEHVRAEFEAALRTGAAYYRTERRWPDSPFWSRRHLELPKFIVHRGPPMAIDPPEGNTSDLSLKLTSIDTTFGIQRRLNQTGFKAGREDDIYGPVTTAAVKRFQQFCQDNIGSDPRIIDAGPVDGIAGPLTKAALLSFYGA